MIYRHFSMVDIHYIVNIKLLCRFFKIILLIFRSWGEYSIKSGYYAAHGWKNMSCSQSLMVLHISSPQFGN